MLRPARPRIFLLALLLLAAGTGCRPAPKPVERRPDIPRNPPEKTADTPAAPDIPEAPDERQPAPPVEPPRQNRPTPLPDAAATWKNSQAAMLFNGVRLQASLTATPGPLPAWKLAAQNKLGDSLAVDITLATPQPAADTAALVKLNPDLATALPGISQLAATVHPGYATLYANKLALLKPTVAVGRFDTLVSRHNYYDCETILTLRHPTTNRAALLIQSEMDVLTDGSDGDRLAQRDGESPTFQPVTSYGWPKRTATPNPFVAVLLAQVAAARQEIALPATTRERKAELSKVIGTAERQVADMRVRSFLVGSLDPFIAIPTFLMTDPSPAAPKVGDLCVVIVGGVLYPALLGDAGPNTKTGEASLFIAKAINPATTAASRPMSDLKATYLIFPGTAEKPFAPPDLAKLRARCAQVLAEFGGTQGDLHHWVPDPPPPPPATPTGIP